VQPGVYPLTIYKGDSFDFFFRIRGASPDGGVTPGAYQNLTGFTGKAQIRATTASDTVLAEFTVTIPDQNISGNLGSVLMSLTKEQTVDLTDGVWDIQLSSGTKSQTYLKGKVKVIEQVTRP
jgi:hypothetical protein